MIVTKLTGSVFVSTDDVLRMVHDTLDAGGYLDQFTAMSTEPGFVVNRDGDVIGVEFKISYESEG